MAKQGNYITAPTSNANWAAGFADSLSDLSDNYRDQATAKKDSELAAEALAYGRSRDVLSDKRFADKEALVNTQRDALTKGITDYTPANARAKTLESNPELKAYVDQYRNKQSLVIGENFIAELMSDQVGAPSREDVKKNVVGGSSTGLIRSDIPKDILGTIAQGVERGTITKDQYADYTGRIAALNTTIDDYVGSEANVYRAPETARLAKELISGGADPIAAYTLAEKTAAQYPSKKELSTASVNVQKVASARNEYLAEMAFKIAKDIKGSTYSGVKSSEVKVADAVAHIEKMDAGWWDTSTLQNRYQKAIDEGINPGVALASLDKYVTLKGFGKGVTGTDDDYLAFAKATEAAGKSKGDKTKYDDFIAKEAAYVDPILQNKKAFMGGLEDISIRPTLTNKYANEYYASGDTTTPKKDVLSKELLNSSVSEKQDTLKKLQKELFDAHSAGDSTRVSNISSRMDLVQNNLGQAEMYQNDQEMLAKIKSKDSGSMFYNASTLSIMRFNEKGIKEPWENTIKLINSNPAITGNNRVDEKLYLLSKDDPVLQQRIMDRSNQAIYKYLTDKVSTKISVVGSQSGAGAKVAAKISDLAHYFNLTTFDPTADSYKNKVPKQQKLGLLNEISSYLEDNMGAVNSDIVRPTGVVKSKAVVTPLPTPTLLGSVGTGPTTRPVIGREPVNTGTGPTTRSIVNPVSGSARSQVLPAVSSVNGTNNQAFSQEDINKFQSQILPLGSSYTLTDVVDNVGAFLQKNPKPEFVSMLQNLVRYNRQSMDPLLVKAIIQLTT
jgi:hypothetical protein